MATKKISEDNQTRILLKDHIPVTLVCADTWKPKLAEKAIQACLDKCTFDKVVFLTNDTSCKHAVKIDPLNGLQGYSELMIRELHKYVKTTHCLVVQWDGYVLNPGAWNNDFLKFDFLGSPWQSFNMVGGNGGFSLRSKQLLDTLATSDFGDSPHPEDSYICYRHAKALQDVGIKFCTTPLAKTFSYEGRLWNGEDWYGHPQPWGNQFGFHSFLTKLPEDCDRPNIFHHSGDMGDVIYSLPAIKALGGGVLWLSPQNLYPYPKPARVTPDYKWADNLCPLLNQQDYIWKAQYTPAYPASTDFDLNRFRNDWRSPQTNTWKTMFRLHLDAFELQYPEDKPWLTVDNPVVIEGRPIVVNRVNRYHNNEFNFWELVRQHGDKMVFIGTPEEYEQFKVFCLPLNCIPYHPTPTLLDVARVIAGAKVFVGNQSCPMAVAIGLGKNIIQEVWPGYPNCIFKRENIIYGRKGTVEIPSEWL